MDLTGQRYGRLLVVRINHKRTGKDTHLSWECLCDCGNITTVRSNQLRCGRTRSCGCLQPEAAAKAQTTHGMYGTKAHRTWIKMMERCNNPNAARYHRYGGRGIMVCDRWKDFINFFEDMGNKPTGLTLDRIDNDGNYEPGNCRWISHKENCRNTSQCRYVVYNGQKKTLSEWSEITGIHRTTITSRLNRGVSVDVALGVT